MHVADNKCRATIEVAWFFIAAETGKPGYNLPFMRERIATGTGEVSNPFPLRASHRTLIAIDDRSFCLQTGLKRTWLYSLNYCCERNVDTLYLGFREEVFQ